MNEYTQPSYVGLNEVIDAFQRKAKSPYWSLWDKNQPIEQHNEDDIDAGLEKLIYEIQLREKRNYTRPLTLLLHPKKEQFYDKNKSIKTANIFFVCSDYHNMSNVGNMGNSNMLPIQQQLNSIQSQLSALQNVEDDNEQDDDEDDNDDKTLGYINGINRILEHPIIAGLITKLLTPVQQPVASLSGIETNETEIIEIVNVLFDKGVKIEHLKKLSEMPESKIQMLITML